METLRTITVTVEIDTNKRSESVILDCDSANDASQQVLRWIESQLEE